MNTNSEMSWQKKNKYNTVSLAKWTLAWVLSLALVSFGPKFLWQETVIISVIALLVNIAIAIGIGMILANKRQLLGLDEMQQKLQLNAMAITLGSVLVMGIAYETMSNSHIVAFDAKISHLVIFMGLTYLVSTFILQKKYGCDEGEE